MPKMSMEELDRRVAVVEANIRMMEKLEKKIDDIHASIYQNGLSSKVNTLWEWRKDVHKIILAIVTAFLITWITTFFFARSSDQDRDIKKQLNEIQMELRKQKEAGNGHR